MTPQTHPQGICESNTVGDGTRIWAFAHVLPGARIGQDCNICDHVFIENDVVIGDRVTVKSGVQLWDGVRLADDVFVGPNVTFTNDRFPRSKVSPEQFLETFVGPGASIGGGAVILPGRRIHRGAMVGAGAVVTRDVPPNAVVVGNPARIVGYVTESGPSGAAPSGLPARPATAPENEPAPALGAGLVDGARLIDLRLARDLRGSLAAVELPQDLPFVPVRFFAVFDVPSVDVRGEHAHWVCQQVLVCLKGEVWCIVDDGRHRAEVRLDSPRRGLYMPALTWGTQYRYSSDAVLGVFASHRYDPQDYIRNYEEFIAAVAAR